MRRNLTAALACAVLLVGATFGYALRVAGPIIVPIPQRVIQADTIVLGKVTAVEEKNTSAPRFKGDMQKGEYRVFTVKVDSALRGGNGLTHIKVGCLLPAALRPIEQPQIDGPVKGGFRRPIRPPFVQQLPMLEKGQEVLLFLRPHISEPFYTLNQGSDVIDSKAGNFKADTELVKKCAKMLTEPMTGLKSKEAGDRFLTASLLVLKYRTQTGLAKEEEVSAEESKLILEGLAAGNFDAPRTGGYDPLAPMNIFYQIQPQTGGYVQPQNFQEVPKSMKKWLEDNAGKFRIKKFVAAEQK